MDQAVIKYYRKLLTAGFKNAGSIENPSIFLDPVSEGIRRICGSPTDYLNIFINIRDCTIDTIKYLCVCDPAANVAVEALCDLAKGKKLKEVAFMSSDLILSMVGSKNEEFQKKAEALLDVLNKGLTRYREKLIIEVDYVCC